MHLAFGARNLLLLAPFHSPRLRVYFDVDRAGCFIGLPHSRKSYPAFLVLSMSNFY
jgi:hypothetical protein